MILASIMYIIVMILYIKVRGRNTHRKYFTEGLFIFAIIVVNVAIKMYAIYISDSIVTSPTGGKWFEWILYYSSIGAYSIYSTIGGIQFEGIFDFENRMVLWGYYLVFSSSLFTGLTIASILGSTISYEIYSWFRLKHKLFSLKIGAKKGQDIYIFTSISEDTLTLAKSVKREKPKSLIIFSGYHLESFDRRNSLCMDAAGNNFIYLSLRKGKSSKDLLKRLKINTKNGLHLSAPKDKSPKCPFVKIAIFAFHLDENQYIPNEVINSDFCFDDMNNVLKALMLNYQQEKANLENFITPCNVTEYYILIANQTDYEYYIRRKEQLLNTYIKKVLDPMLSSDENIKFLRKNIERYFQFNLVNEAQIAARTLISKKQDVLKDELIKEKERLSYQTMLLGFGETGREALKAIYIDSTYVDSNFEESQFYAMVVDTTVKEKIGLFAGRNPFFKTIELKNANKSLTYLIKKIEEEKVSSSAKISKEQKEYYQKLDNRLKEEDLRIRKYWKEELNEGHLEKHLKEMKQPLLSYANTSCTSMEFLTILDRFTGSIYDEKNSSNLSDYQTLIVALGDDFENIDFVNILLADIKMETSIKPIKQMQVIAVHIRDERNVERLNWNPEDKQIENLKIIVFGSRKEIYDYQFIIEDLPIYRYDTRYSQFYDFLQSDYLTSNENNNLSEDEKQNIKNIRDILKEKPLETCFDKLSDYLKIDKSYVKVLETITKLTHQYVPINEDNKDYKNWLKLDCFKKSSNYYAKAFDKHLYMQSKEFQDTSDISFNRLVQLLQTEHCRWVRYHITNGWTFGETSNKPRRIHLCINSFSNLRYPERFLDIINVMLALETGERD